MGKLTGSKRRTLEEGTAYVSVHQPKVGIQWKLTKIGDVKCEQGTIVYTLPVEELEVNRRNLVDEKFRTREIITVSSSTCN